MKFTDLKPGESYKFTETDGKHLDGTPRLKTVRAKVLKLYEHSVLCEVETKGGRHFKKGFNRSDTLNFELEKEPPKLSKKEDSERKKHRREVGASLEDLYYFVPGSEARDMTQTIEMFRMVETDHAGRSHECLYDKALKKFERYKENHGDNYRMDLEIEKNMREILKG